MLPRPALRAALLPALALLTLTGCATEVSLPAGEHAADPVCARVLQTTPEDLGGLERRSTTAQATTAWGEPAITVRCGVSPPGPSTDRCLTVDQGDGTSVDWIALEGDDPQLPEHARQGQGSWTFVTYGRRPAVEVVVPVEHATGQPTSTLVDLAPAVQLGEVQRQCVGVEDIYGPDGEDGPGSGVEDGPGSGAEDRPGSGAEDRPGSGAEQD